MTRIFQIVQKSLEFFLTNQNRHYSDPKGRPLYFSDCPETGLHRRSMLHFPILCDLFPLSMFYCANEGKMFKNLIIAAAASEPEANERGSSLISRRLHYRGLQSLFLTKRKELWLCASGRFRMRSGMRKEFWLCANGKT